MNINAISHRIQQELIWPINSIPGRGPIDLRSDPWAHAHTLTLPPSWDPLDHLRCLARATLAETSHHLFSSRIIRGAPARQREFRTAADVASQWFADNLLWEGAPDGFRSGISRKLGGVLSAGVQLANEINTLLPGVMIISQAIYYEVVGFEVNEIFAGYVRTFLAYPPYRCDIRSLTSLINTLMYGLSRRRLILSPENGEDVWASFSRAARVRGPQPISVPARPTPAQLGGI